MQDPTASTAPQQRIATIDVLRGIAIIGILPVNVGAIAQWGYQLNENPAKQITSADYFTDLVLSARMMPLFALLFGMSFELFLRSAAQHTERPRLVMARRLFFLLIVGILHFLVYPGEVLMFYAIGGLIVLLPASLAPRHFAALTGILLVIVTAPIDGPLKLPGLFLTGAAMTRYDFVPVLQKNNRLAATLLALFTFLAVIAVYFQLPDIGIGSFSKPGRVAGVLTMFALVIAITLAMKAPNIARVLEFLFAAMGRMAFTNYLSATALVLLIGHLLDAQYFAFQSMYGLYVAAVIVPIQWAFSKVWSRYFFYGPLEWLWRTATWWKPQPNRRWAN